MADRLAGIYPALQATFSKNGDLDTQSMERQVAFNIECGTHGLVFPVLGGELKHMSESERQRMVEVVVGSAAGQVPVVAGVSAPCTPIAVEHARHAARVGADAIIALPPFPNSGGHDEMVSYYRAIAAAFEGPVFVQHTGGALSPALIVELLRDIEWVQYVKEETPPSGHSISAILSQAGPECLGVFGGAHGNWIVSEMQRGATGFVPAAHVTDVYVKVWDAYQAGDEDKARRIHESMLPMLAVLRLVGLRLCKEVLVRRGVIASATMRIPGSTALDAQDRHHLDVAMERMREHMIA